VHGVGFSGVCTSKREVQHCARIVAACKSLALRIPFVTEFYSFQYSLPLLPPPLVDELGVVSLVRTLFHDAFVTAEVSV
jgi:hypothetical protein